MTDIINELHNAAWQARTYEIARDRGYPDDIKTIALETYVATLERVKARLLEEGAQKG